MKESAIAIVGMAGRFPKAHNLAEFWQNLRDGVESIRTFSDAELLDAGVRPEELANPDYVKSGTVLEDVAMFDAAFFGFSPKDAAVMDPQHRHFLECAWEALENAGHAPENFAGSIGVYAGSGLNAYMIHNLLNNRRLMESAGLFLIRQTGNDKDVLATRVSYQLNLRGPSINVQTACSTSLVAVHLACQSLLNQECDMALAGGVTIEMPHGHGYIYREGEILSRDGHCRAFDAASSGTIFSSGVGIVVLRRLEDAIDDHDTIRAVILGSAINNDGSRKVGYLAPSVDGQAEVIAEALGVAGLRADDISYLETHGTGTAVGDPIEIKGLTQAYRETSDRKGFCAIGSLKTNIGHLDTAAGVAGLIKTTLALEHRQIPPSLHFHTPNPLIDFENSPVYVNTKLVDWNANGAPRHAGVTSLGIGGTNAHVVLEEAPATTKRSATSKPYQLLVLSAKTDTALERATSNLADHLRDHSDLNLADVAFTCQAGRKAFARRRAVVARDIKEAAELLAAPESKGVFSGAAASPLPSVVFMFSGQGSQYVNMGRDLYGAEPVFRSNLDRCAESLLPHLGLDLRTLLYPPEQDIAGATEQLTRTSITQPALFALEYSLAQWWMANGIRPQAMVGHSIGEYVAACIAGVISLEDGLAISAVRGRLMQEMPSGSMLAVPLATGEFPLPATLSIAAVNSPGQCVVSGPMDAIDDLERDITKRGVTCRKLHTSHAFHSSMMDPMLDAFRKYMQGVRLKPFEIPYLSNVSGTWITAAQATDPAYWVTHLRQTVKFSDCLAELFREPGRVLVEVGPGQALASLARLHPDKNAKVFSSVRHPQEKVSDVHFLLNTLGQVWISGVPVDWSALHSGESVQRVPLPTYPFERQRFWIDPDNQRSASISSLPVKTNAEDGINRWFHRRVWKRAAISTNPAPGTACWMILADESALSSQIIAQLDTAGHQVIQVTSGQSYKRLGQGMYRVRPGVREDYDALLADLVKRKTPPQKIVHLWSVCDPSTETSIDGLLDRSFYSLLFLAQALGDQDLAKIEIAAISNGLQSVSGESIVQPARAALLGPMKVIPKEFPDTACRGIDVDLKAGKPEEMASQIIAELSAPVADVVVAYRGQERWVESFEPIDLRENLDRTRLKQKGVYLITGGLGGIGLVIAEHLARSLQARLVLLGRTALPPRSDWEPLAATDHPWNAVQHKIRKLLEIESLGAELLTVATDVTKRDEMESAVKLARQKFGAIDGVIHAAGVIEDSPLQVKTRESATRVLDPKVKGTLILKEIFRDTPLDCFVLFSSISSVQPPAGQVDYAAANAFLDAFAASQADSNVFAINWGRWKDVGMGAGGASAHPMLDRVLVETADETIHSGHLNCDRHWVIGEHRLKSGEALIPGTGYLELASAALTHGRFEGGVEFEDVFFVAPLTFGPKETKEVRVHLRRDRSAFRFSILTNDGDWTEHASGQIARCTKKPPAACNLTEIIAKCHRRTINFDDAHRTRQEKYFDFGPRWRNLKTLHVGEGEGLAELELRQDLSDDVSAYGIHPALLDLATGSALYLIDGYEESQNLYLPFSYKRIRVYRQLPAKLYSHIRSRQEITSQREIATFDLTLLDGQGQVLAEIEEFSMRRIAEPSEVKETARTHTYQTPLHLSLPTGRANEIGPVEGVQAFTRILSSDVPPSIIVFPGDLETKTTNLPVTKQPAAPAAVSADEVETVLAGWWQELLGVERVALDDDFFDLGGQSLVAVRLFSKIRKTYQAEFGLSTLFEARTIRQLAQLVRQARKPAESVEIKASSAIVPIQTQGAHLPLFLISGLGGNVLNFHNLTRHLGEDQPVYALQPQGLDGKGPFHTRVEEMAAYYIREIRAIQPQGPYCLAGYSFGGFVAFEMAQQIRRQGGKIGLVGLLDTIEWHYLEQVKKHLSLRNRLTLYKSRLDHVLFDEDRFEYLKQSFVARSSKHLYRLFEALGRPLPQKVGSIADVNAFAAANYKPKVYPGPLTIFRSIKREALDGDDELLGWRGLAAAGVDVHDIPGTHHDITREPHVRVLAEKLRFCLSRASQEQPVVGMEESSPEELPEVVSTYLGKL